MELLGPGRGGDAVRSCPKGLVVLDGVFPLFLKLAGKPCLVVGGGPVAERKVLSLLDTGAAVKVVSPRLTDRLEALARQGRITAEAREYRAGDLAGSLLAFEATGDPETARRVASEGRSRGVLVNSADEPDECDFFFPAIHRQGDLILAACTSGVAPGLAGRIRQAWEAQYGGAYGVFLDAYRRFRDEVKSRFPDDADERRRLLQDVLDSSLLDEAAGRTSGEIFARMMQWIS